MEFDYLDRHEENYDTTHDDCISADELQDMVDKFEMDFYPDITLKELRAHTENFIARLTELCKERS